MESAEEDFMDASDLLLAVEGAMRDFNENNHGDIIGLYTTVRVAKEKVLCGIEKMQNGTGKAKRKPALKPTPKI